MNKKGFTLIEVMIVLLVFSIGVLAVLRLILHNMETMSQLEAKSTATLLAKEGIELVYNTRDSNRIASLPWDCIINPNYNGQTENQFCKNHFLDNGGIWKIENYENIQRTTINPEYIFEESKLYIKDNITTKYTHEVNDQPSIFSRYIYFTGVKDNDNIINTGYILKIESHVIYQKGSRTGEIILESFIGNY
ncbi:MAG: prepilin-type N-terminal cleavage/methylation domain-containing protein [Candidatus Absconditabacteria bacterium]|nr:prepilin-type N-terminal cleavage/methylation domain-containing protein [Candidatus Absconditabacteria bacterium]